MDYHNNPEATVVAGTFGYTPLKNFATFSFLF
jgi:hypothetical protein